MRRALLALLLLSLLPALAHAQCNGCYLFEPFNGTTTSPDWYTDNFGPLQWPSDGMGAQAVRLFDCASPSPSSLCTTSTSSTGQEAAISICKNDIQHAGFQPGTGTGTGCIDNGNGMHEETWYRYHIRIAPGYTPTPGTQNAIMEFHVDSQTIADAAAHGGVTAYSTEFNIIADGTACTGSPIYCTTAGTNPRLFIQIPGGATSCGTACQKRFFPFAPNSLLINHWYDMVLHMVWDADPTIGLAQWWVDGTKMLDTHLSTEYTRSDSTHSYGESMGMYNYRHWANYTSAVDGENFVWGPTNTSIGFAIPSGTTRTAATCNASDVQTAVAASSDGDTVLVPGGTCSWDHTTNFVTIPSSKAITLNGQGITTINLDNGSDPGSETVGAFYINASTAGNTFVTGFTFNGGYINGRCPIQIIDSFSPQTQTFRFHHNTINMNSGSSPLVAICIQGDGQGLLDHNTFNTTVDFSDFTQNFGEGNPAPQTAWSEDLTPGSANMLFFEDNTANGPANLNPTGTSLSQNYGGVRVVYRHNTLNNVGLDAHGFCNVSTPSCQPPNQPNSCQYVNTRWWEIYQNNFVATGTTTNVFAWIALRGGSGVVWGNTASGTNLGAGQVQMQSDCSPTSGFAYPAQDQVGQGITVSNGSQATHASPAYLWGNTGKFPIGSTNTTYVQSGRDFLVSTTQPATLTRCESAADVTAGCPVSYNYVPFTYPHPLAGGQVPPSAPTSLVGTVSGSTVSLSWTASSGTPVPTAYTLYRSTVHNGPYTAVASGIAAVSTTDTPASGTYFYVVSAFVGGVVSTVSGNGTTATVTCMTACPFPTSTVFTLAGNSQAGFNGTFTSTGQPTTGSFTFSSSTNSIGSGGGVWQPPAESTRSNEAQVTTSATLTLSFAPTSLALGTANVGSTTGPQTTQIRNTSPAGNTVTISSISFTGTNPGDFSLTQNCTGAPGLASQQTCTVNVSFTPTAAGARSANLTFVDNATGSPQTVPVSGTGVAQAPGVSLSPTSLNFQSQTLSTTSVAQSIILTNTGSGALTITSVVASGDFAVTTVPATNCGTTLASLATCSLNVTFTPTATGGRTGAVTITDNATGSPHVAGLTGTGITTKCALSNNVALTGAVVVCQ